MKRLASLALAGFLTCGCGDQASLKPGREAMIYSAGKDDPVTLWANGGRTIGDLPAGTRVRYVDDQGKHGDARIIVLEGEHNGVSCEVPKENLKPLPK